MTSGHQGNSNAVKWTCEQDDALRKLHSDGFSGAEAAADINREFRTTYSRNAIIGRLHRLGLTQPPVVRRIQKKAAAKADKPGPPAKPRPRPIKTFLAEAFVPRAVDIVPRNVPLIDLEPNDCRYPYGNDVFLFCGHPKLDGSSYCAAHFRLCLGTRAAERIFA